MRSLWDDGLEKVASGFTSVEESRASFHSARPEIR